MGAYGYGIDWPFLADVDFSSKQWFAVAAASTADYVKVATGTCGSAGAPIGIIQNDPQAGAEAQVRMVGMSKAVVDASNSSISYGEYLSPVPASPGKLEPHAPTKTGCPFAISLGATVSSGSARINVWVIGPNVGQNV